MPSGLDRIQVLMHPDIYAAVLTLVNVTGKTKSNMCSELMSAALKLPKYKALLAEAEGAQVVEPKEDPRTPARRGSVHRQPSIAVKNEAKRVSSYKELLKEEPTEEEGFDISKITPEKLKEMQQLLKMMEMMKAMQS